MFLIISMSYIKKKIHLNIFIISGDIAMIISFGAPGIHFRLIF